MRLSRFGALLFILLLPASALAAPGDIVFVTQTPQPADFATIGSTFANHGGSEFDAPRGGDLFIRYADGSFKNLTRAAGYGVDGLQAAGSIAVRDPAVYWTGDKVVFSMVIGGASRQYEYLHFFWQIYEITGLGKNQTPVITKVPNQPENFNNVMPTYGTDDRILFMSDRPRNGAAHLYPQRDEYESTKSVSGLWSLNPQTGNLVLLDHAPSGAFHPFVDSFGRVIYTRWDHMQRDQQAGGLTDYGAFNYASEAADAARINSQNEFYPEARSESERTDPNLNLHRFNHFFPWQINEDGTEHETLNHVGRHELHGYFDRTFNDDPNLEEYYGQIHRTNPNNLENFFEIREDPRNPGIYFGIDAPEFQTHAAGQILKINGALGTPGDQMIVTYVTPRETSQPTDTPGANNTGLYRNPLPMSTGALVASHTTETRGDHNDGTTAVPISRYQFRIKTLRQSGSYWVPDQMLTGGIQKSLTFWDPDNLVTFSGPLWELQPVELVSRARPTSHRGQMESPELGIFQQEGVDVASFRDYMVQNGLALIVSRNVTSRDAADVQQPYNLRVANTNTQKIARSGKIYDILHLQLFQGDQIRGYGGTSDPNEGRRVLPVPMHNALWANVPDPSGPAASVQIAADGSTAAFVPARRAMTWQLTSPAGSGVIRERYWLTFQPGEIRVCASCHGLNSHDQLGQGVPANPPEALRQLLRFWRDQRPTPPSNPEDPGNPGSDPGNPTANDQPQYSISFGSTKKKTALAGVLMAGWKSTIGVGGKTSASAGKAVQLTLSINGIACPAPIKNFTTDGAGNALFSGKAPSANQDYQLSFQTLYQGAVAGTADTTLLCGKKRQKIRALSLKDLTKLCRAFTKW